ncbi:hypothetical protein C8R46DRAFT_870792, partial [Mycena filopes]
TCPPDVPPWVAHAFAQLSGTAAGKTFEEVLQAWLLLERKYGFVAGATNSSFSKVKRPQAVTDWVRDGRGRTVEIRQIGDVAKFGDEWWGWWRALQPKWRAHRDGERPEEPAGNTDWGKLVVPGQNGLLSVVAALYWWRVAEQG